MKSFYVGNYSTHGIYLVDENFHPIYSSEDFSNFSYVCKNSDLLYAITETFPAYLVCYRNLGNSLQKVNQSLLGMEGPCFLTIDDIRNQLYVACYAIRCYFRFCFTRRWFDW